MNNAKPHMLRNPEKISYNEFKDMVGNIMDKEAKALVCLAYASGARVSELNQIEANDVWVDKDYLIIRSHVLKKRSKTEEIKLVPVRVDEGWLVKPILNWKETIGSGVLFALHRATIYRKVFEAISINPHGFRKLRLTHLATRFKFTDQQLTKFAGWADSSPAKAYVKLNLDDIKY